MDWWNIKIYEDIKWKGDKKYKNLNAFVNDASIVEHHLFWNI